MIHALLTDPLMRMADLAASRSWGTRAVSGANLLLAGVAFLLLYAEGAYAMEHESKDSAALSVVQLAMTASFVVAGACAVIVVTGRPRRLADRRLQIGVAGAAIAWPLTCVLLVVAAALAY